MSCQGEIFLSLWVNLMRNSRVLSIPSGSCSRRSGEKSPAAGWTGAVSDRVGNIRSAFKRRQRRAGRATHRARSPGKTRRRRRGIARDEHVEKGACRKRRARTWESRIVASRAASARDGTRRVGRGSAKRRNAPLYVQSFSTELPRSMFFRGASRSPSRACPPRSRRRRAWRPARPRTSPRRRWSRAPETYWRNFTDASRFAAVRSALVGARACVSRRRRVEGVSVARARWGEVSFVWRIPKNKGLSAPGRLFKGRRSRLGAPETRRPLANANLAPRRASTAADSAS